MSADVSRPASDPKWEWPALGSISPVLEALLTACLAAQANGQPLPVEVDAAVLAAEQAMDAGEKAVAEGFRPTRPLHGWVCFHCGEVFMTPGSARDHFGADPLADPACRIKAGEERGLVMALRRAEAELERYRAEDSDKDREMQGMRADHARALVREEEKGYAKGLRDQAGRLAEPDEDFVECVARRLQPDAALHVSNVSRAIAWALSSS